MIIKLDYREKKLNGQLLKLKDTNKFDKIYKTVYYSANGEIIGSIYFNFKENLELLNESWYIGDNRKLIKEIRKIYDPKRHKYITIEDRLIRE